MDKKTLVIIEWMEKGLKKYRKASEAMEYAIKDYLEWMAVNGYTQSTLLICLIGWSGVWRYFF